MGELSVFVDESGDFGALAAHCPFYIVSLVVHDQDEPIDAQLGRLEKSCVNRGSTGMGQFTPRR